MHTQIGRTTAIGASTAGIEGWQGKLSRGKERIAIQRFFAELMLLIYIYGLNNDEDAKNTVFSYIIDIIPPSTNKYALFIVHCKIIRY